MIKELPSEQHMPQELRELVKLSTACLGRVIQATVGLEMFQFIENIRTTMVELRSQDTQQTLQTLKTVFFKLQKLESKDRLTVARAFTLMLELINTCENAYRSHRLAQHMRENNLWNSSAALTKPKAIIYVLTAHPTEARSPESIAVFHLLQRHLIDFLSADESLQNLEKNLYHALSLAWRTTIVREKAPTVADEAEHIYSTLLKPEILQSLLSVSHELVPMYIRSWVGGDKDGHPGVDEKVMHQSLNLSRRHLLEFAHLQLDEVDKTLKVFPQKTLQKDFGQLLKILKSLRQITTADAGRVKKLRRQLQAFSNKYIRQVGSLHPNLLQLRQLLHVFPGLVVPLELRESSDVLMSDPRAQGGLAIDKMLASLRKFSKGGDPRWYARGFIISMASSVEHLRVADKKVRGVFGQARIPVIPLLEQAESLNNSTEILREWVQDPQLGRDIRKEWGGICEIMVGYSDSAKESGVLPSRLEIAQAMNRLDQVAREEKVTPLFFQGSGGSVDRGGGRVEDQTAWWPHSALQIYKVTIQGEMVEHSLATEEIARGQVERIVQSVSAALQKPAVPPHMSALKDFAAKVAQSYRDMIQDSDFLHVVERATPYLDLGELRIGSRPTSRTTRLSVKGLRAIPWVLCWTQTRLLFPTWWGVGTAWKNSSSKDRQQLRQAFVEEPVFSSYVRALGFTLAKIEMAVWSMYLQQSGLDARLIQRFEKLFSEELEAVSEMHRFICENENPLWFRPWLGASIRLRSPMIHPLNLLQIIAVEEKDFALFRLTVTGVSSGMLTTG